MRVLDERTELDIDTADLGEGYTYERNIVLPGAYESIDNVTKFALDESDYERVLMYHEYTPEELEARELEASAITVDDLAFAVAELAATVAMLLDVGAGEDVDADTMKYDVFSYVPEETCEGVSKNGSAVREND